MLDKQDITAIAKAVVEEADTHNHGFHIDAEAHYKDHMELRDLLIVFKSTKGLFFKAFVGLIIIGTLALVVIGATFGKILK